MQWWVFYGRYVPNSEVLGLRMRRNGQMEQSISIGPVQSRKVVLLERWFFETFLVGSNRSIQFRPNIPEILVEWIAPYTLMPTWVHQTCTHYLRQKCRLKSTRYFRQKQLKTLIFGFESNSPLFHRNRLFLGLLKSTIFQSVSRIYSTLALLRQHKKTETCWAYSANP